MRIFLAILLMFSNTALAETKILECKLNGHCLMFDDCPFVDLPVSVYQDDETNELTVFAADTSHIVSRSQFGRITVYTTIKVEQTIVPSEGEYLSLVYDEKGQATLNQFAAITHFDGDELRSGHLTGTCEAPQ